MKRTLLISVAALALATGSAFAQGGGANTPMANPSGPSGGGASVGGGASGGAGMNQDALPGAKAPAKGAQERGGMEKQKSTQQAPSNRQSADDKAGHPATRQSQDDKSPPSTKQSQGQTAPATQQQSQGAQPSGSKQGANERHEGGTKQGATEQPMKSSNVSLTTEQKTTIRSTVLTSSAPRVTNVNFDIKVGVAVPRTVRVAPLPATLISIEPEWRGYMYFVYNDEIIIVEPRTLRIVAVLVV